MSGSDGAVAGRVPGVNLSSGRPPAIPATLVGIGAASLVLTGRPAGYLAGLALAGAWLVLPLSATFVVGQVGTVALADHLSLGLLLGVQVGLFGLLVVAAADEPRRAQGGAILAVATAGLGAVVFGAYLQSGSLPVAVAVAVGAVGFASYALHRLGLFTTGRLDDGRD